MSNSIQLPSGYPALLEELKRRIRSAQTRAALAVSRELVLLYWSIGRDILARQDAEGGGARRSLTGLPKISESNFPASRASVPEI